MLKWVNISDDLPPLGRCVAVQVTEKSIPLVAYMKNTSNGSDPYWIVPNPWGPLTVECWCDCLPALPDPKKAAFNEEYEKTASK